LALFVAHRALHPDASADAAPHRIVITEDDLRQMSVAWMAQGRPPLTAAQWASLIETKVREEILFREALALGLDRNDAIVKRRMAQKMEFLAQDLSKVDDPTPAELRRWFEGRRGEFALPPRASFRLLYFSPDRRGSGTRASAETAKAKLAKATRDAPVPEALSDPFMFRDHYVDRTPDQIARELGPGFARAVFALAPTAAWQGPIESGYGWHLVWLDALERGRVPAFEEVEREVKAAWIDEQSSSARRQAYEAMRARYEVVLPAPPAAAAGAAAR
jgi:hypothetical protein